MRTGYGNTLVQTGLLGRSARVRRADGCTQRRLENQQTRGVALLTAKEELGFHLRTEHSLVDGNQRTSVSERDKPEAEGHCITVIRRNKHCLRKLLHYLCCPFYRQKEPKE